MAKEKLDELDKRKQELEVELEQLQGELDDSLNQVRADVRTKLDAKAFIRKYPLATAGAAVFAGFLFGYSRKSSHSSADHDKHSPHSDDENPIIHELKKLASKKAVALASFLIERKLKG